MVCAPTLLTVAYYVKIVSKKKLGLRERERRRELPNLSVHFARLLAVVLDFLQHRNTQSSNSDFVIRRSSHRSKCEYKTMLANTARL